MRFESITGRFVWKGGSSIPAKILGHDGDDGSVVGIANRLTRQLELLEQYYTAERLSLKCSCGGELDFTRLAAEQDFKACRLDIEHFLDIHGDCGALKSEPSEAPRHPGIYDEFKELQYELQQRTTPFPRSERFKRRTENGITYVEPTEETYDEVARLSKENAENACEIQLLKEDLEIRSRHVKELQYKLREAKRFKPLDIDADTADAAEMPTDHFGEKWDAFFEKEYAWVKMKLDELKGVTEAELNNQVTWKDAIEGLLKGVTEAAEPLRGREIKRGYITGSVRTLPRWNIAGPPPSDGDANGVCINPELWEPDPGLEEVRISAKRREEGWELPAGYPQLEQQVPLDDQYGEEFEERFPWRKK